jgi:hypothetical protein
MLLVKCVPAAHKVVWLSRAGPGALLDDVDVWCVSFPALP